MASPEQIVEFDLADARTAVEVPSGRVQALQARDFGFIGTTEFTVAADNAEEAQAGPGGWNLFDLRRRHRRTTGICVSVNVAMGGSLPHGGAGGRQEANPNMGGISTNMAPNCLSAAAPNNGSGQQVLRDLPGRIVTSGLLDLSHRRHGSLAEGLARESRRPHAHVAGEDLLASAANGFGRLGYLRMVLAKQSGTDR